MRTESPVLWTALGLMAAALTAVRADYASTVLGDAPAGYWRFSEAAVQSSPDYATNRGTFGFSGYGVYTGGAVHPAAGALAGDPANTGARISNVNGGSGGAACVRIPWQPQLNTTGAFSAEFWARPAFTTAIACPAASVDFNTTTRYGWLFYQGPPSLGDGNGWFFRIYHSTGYTYASVAAPLNTNRWYHVVGTFDGGGTIKLYTNGALAATAVMPDDYTPNTNRTDVPMTFGGRGDGAAGDYGWGGLLDEVAYYTNALSDNVVLAHYQAGTNASPATAYAPLVQASQPALYLRLDEPAFTPSMALNSGALGLAANGTYRYWSGTTAGLNGATYPGLEATNTVLQTSGTNGFVAIPRMNLNTDTVTMDCWIQRNGAQASDAGIFFHRGGAGTATGIGFRGTTGALGYHWNDQANTYTWASGLTPPDSAWVYVALAVAPDKAVMYMYDGTTWRSAVNAVAHPAQAFADVTRIGAGQDNAQFFNGLIDEAAIYTDTLTEGQLRTHALAGFGDPAHKPPQFVSDPPTVSPAGTIYRTTPFTLTANAYGEPPLWFQWRKDSVDLPGATSVSYTRIATAATAGAYTVVVSNANGSVTSSPIGIAVNPAAPPTITNQPLSRWVYAAGTASFAVAADGTAPFSYQWKHAGTNLPGATNATLFVANCTVAETGAYSVGVSNVAGGVLSSAAALAFRVPAPGSFEERVVANRPVAYWRLGETNGTVAFDYAGGNDATYYNVAQGQAGSILGDSNGSAGFDGTKAYVGTGIGLLNNRAQFSVMGWLKRGATHSTRGGYFGQNDLLEFGDAGGGTGIEAWIDATAGSILTAWPWPDNQWGFVVLAASGTSNTLYIDGQQVGTRTSSVSSYGTNGFSFNIGGGGIFNSPTVNGDWFNGFIDEVAVFDKALPADTVAALYSAGRFGGTTPPFITRNPLGATVTVGSSVVLKGGADGSLPLSFQWKKDGAKIPGATAAELTLAKAYFTDTGSYVLWATNGVGFTNSAAASLTVLPVPTFANLTNNLVLHLRFDGDYSDSSGRGNDAVANSGAPAFLPGKINQGVHIATTPGLNFLTLNNSSGELVFDDTASFSVAFWLKYTVPFNDVPIIGNAVDSTYQLGWVLTEASGGIEYSLASTPSTGTYIGFPIGGHKNINDGAWHHVVAVVDRGLQIATAYVDGALAHHWSIAGLGSLNSGNRIAIGQDPTGNYGTATFDLDDVGIWRRALTAYEAASIYGAADKSGNSFDVYGPITVAVKLVGTNVDVNWPAGTLLEATSLTGTYSPVPGATAPFYRTTATGSAMFFRVQQ